MVRSEAVYNLQWNKNIIGRDTQVRFMTDLPPDCVVPFAEPSTFIRTSNKVGTIFTVHCFQLRGGRLIADASKSARTSEAAVELAERLSTVKAGVVALSQEIDVETDCYDEPRVLCRIGSFPRGLFADL
jgi:hypothetical protein